MKRKLTTHEQKSETKKLAKEKADRRIEMNLESSFGDILASLKKLKKEFFNKNYLQGDTEKNYYCTVLGDTCVLKNLSKYISNINHAHLANTTPLLNIENLLLKLGDGPEKINLDVIVSFDEYIQINIIDPIWNFHFHNISHPETKSDAEEQIDKLTRDECSALLHSINRPLPEDVDSFSETYKQIAGMLFSTQVQAEEKQSLTMALQRRIFALGEAEKDLVQEIAGYLEQENLLNPAQVSKVWNKLFHPPLIQAHASSLIQAIENADFEKAIKIIDRNPLLMFEYGLDKEGKLISPLKLTFKICDYPIWNHFLNKIEDNPKLVERVKEIYQEQKPMDLLTPLTAIYKTFCSKLKKWLNENKMAIDPSQRTMTEKRIRKEVEKEIIKPFNKALYQLIPVYMFKNFCAENSLYWKINGPVCLYKYAQYHKIEGIAGDQDKAVDFLLAYLNSDDSCYFLYRQGNLKMEKASDTILHYEIGDNWIVQQYENELEIFTYFWKTITKILNDSIKSLSNQQKTINNPNNQ